jgi:hypothetical protein
MAQALIDALHIILGPPEYIRPDATGQSDRSGQATWRTSWVEGQRLPLDQAVEEALVIATEFALGHQTADGG